MVNVLGQRPRIHPDDLARAVLAVEEWLGLTLKVGAIEARLDPAQQKQLVDLARRAKLDAKGERALRRLVEVVAPGELKAAQDEREARETQLREFREAAERPPRRVLLPEGWAGVPAGVQDDLGARKLEPVDLAVLLEMCLTFSTGSVDPARAGRGDVRWDGETLVVRNKGRSLVLDWGVVAQDFDRSLGRLVACGWLEVTMDGTEARFELGRRFAPGSK